jgi:hypothetical protein
MPALPVVPNVVRFKLLWTIGEDLSVSTTFYELYSGGPPDATDCLALATDVYNECVTDVIGLVSADADLTGVDCEDIGSGSGAHGTYIHSTTGGDTVGSPLPASACTLVNCQIARRYRGGKPRLYLPAAQSSSMQDAQTWTATYQTDYQDNLNTFFTAVAAFTSGSTTLAGHRNVSYYSGFTPVADPTTGRYRNVPKRRATPLVDVITATTVNIRIGSQRRRIGA